MRKLVYGFLTSLDGYIESPEREIDWVRVEPEFHRFANEQERRFAANLYGRRLYEVMSYWQTAEEDASLPDYEHEYARIWKATPKVVFSRTLESVGENARLVREDAAKEVRRLKAEPGGDLNVGGAELAASLMPLGLIDEYQLYVQPILLGGGTPMFPPLKERVGLRLMESRTFASGVVFLRYERAEEG
jgi:dihydrofolate reductase